jgi:glycosyltransferase 2 family protein
MKRLYRYTIAAFAASALTPARAGELLRVWALKTRDAVPVADSTAVALAEKLLDVITLLLVCVPLPWLLPHLPEWVTDAMLVCGSIALGIFIAMFFAVGRVEAREPRSWLGRFIAGLHALREPKQMVLAMLVLVIMWFLDLVAVSLVLYAIDVPISIGGAMLILFSFNLAIAIPSTPGQVGALQVGALAATQVLRIPEEAGLAFGLLYQAMQLIPLVILGFVLELDLVRGRIPEPEAAS